MILTITSVFQHDFNYLKKKKGNIEKCRNLCLMNDFFNTAHQSATCASHNVAECIVYRQWCRWFDGDEYLLIGKATPQNRLDI